MSARRRNDRLRTQSNQRAISVAGRTTMADIARDVPVPGRAAVPGLLRSAAGDCGVILMHGSGGDMNSGRLPLYTAALADAGFAVLRFTIKPPSMPTRIKCCQVRCIRP